MTARTIPPARLALLRKAMKRQQRETADRGLPAEHIDAEALLILQGYRCKCGCGEPLDLESKWDAENPPPGYPVVAHEFYRRGKNSPGHVLGNTWWWRFQCNAREAAKENVARGRGNRMAVRRSSEDAEAGSVADGVDRPLPRSASASSPKRRSRIKGGGFRGHRKFNGEPVWRKQ
jgi:hypothetical protein